LRKQIDSKYASYRNINAIGFTTDVHLYMKASDLVVTKPGGLSSTEAMVCNIPMILTSPIPGVETENYDTLTKLGVAIGGDSDVKASYAFEEIVKDSGLGYKITCNQKKYINPDAAKEICRYVLKDLGVEIDEPDCAKL
ncbi:MAG: UDP-N-acetylglucosamine--LPS N-acetylglucosamine transferase, partial [Clostridia bacterium]|nr:UDP-N-acetylglucosamine--LPS N-acetylglucosamine transferase [Clostridia bacterium]